LKRRNGQFSILCGSNGRIPATQAIPASIMIHSDAAHAAEIKLLEEKLDALIQLYSAVKDENRSLKVKQEELVREKAKLLEKSSLVKTRVEAMITRLKAMEHGS
jgi:cell division protein ZapB